MKDYEEDETLGSCGCVDYHMADCPIRTAHFDMELGSYWDNVEDLEGY